MKVPVRPTPALQVGRTNMKHRPLPQSPALLLPAVYDDGAATLAFVVGSHGLPNEGQRGKSVVGNAMIWPVRVVVLQNHPLAAQFL